MFEISLISLWSFLHPSFFSSLLRPVSNQISSYGGPYNRSVAFLERTFVVLKL